MADEAESFLKNKDLLNESIASLITRLQDYAPTQWTRVKREGAIYATQCGNIKITVGRAPHFPPFGGGDPLIGLYDLEQNKQEFISSDAYPAHSTLLERLYQHLEKNVQGHCPERPAPKMRNAIDLIYDLSEISDIDDDDF